MLKKPFVLTLILYGLTILLSIVVGIILAIIGLKSNPGAYTALPIFAGLWVGHIYTGEYKEALTKELKQKIALYYFGLQLILSLIFLAIMGLIAPKLVANTVLVALITIFTFLIALIEAFITYKALGQGCKQKLKQLERIANAQKASESQA